MEDVKQDMLADFTDPMLIVKKSRLWNITAWSRVLAISGFILISFLIVSIIAAYLVQQQKSMGRKIMNNQEATFLLIACAALITIILLVFLLRFAIYTRRGMRNNDQEHFNEGIASLKIYFIINGIAGILYCFLFLIGLLIK